jgi:drug/metabolite transporter (DMT)-like permease
MIPKQNSEDNTGVNYFMMNLIAFAFATLMLMLAALLTREPLIIPVRRATWLALGWLVFASVVGYAINVLVIQEKSAFYASFSSVLTPIVTIVVSFFVFSEKITPFFFAGICLIFIGLFFSGHLKLKELKALFRKHVASGVRQ